MKATISIEYRGPEDYDVEYPEEVIDAFETADLISYVAIDMRDKLIAAGYLHDIEPMRLQ